MKMLHFVDAAGSDENSLPCNPINGRSIDRLDINQKP